MTLDGLFYLLGFHFSILQEESFRLHRLEDHFITTSLSLKLFVMDTITKNQLAFIPGVLYFP